jgi:hypothetical protein
MALGDDPRNGNERFPLLSIEGHAEALSTALVSIDSEQLKRGVSEIRAARADKRGLWVTGNGGSAAIADHLLYNWVKGTYTPRNHQFMFVPWSPTRLQLRRQLPASTRNAGRDRRSLTYEFLIGKQPEHTGVGRKKWA